jgi:hypothetical protein
MGLTNGNELVSAAVAKSHVMKAEMKMQRNLERIIQMVDGETELPDVGLYVN